MNQQKLLRVYQPAAFFITLVFTGITLALVPAERSLGGNLRIVLLHGAWVETGKIVFAVSGLTGLTGLLVRWVWLKPVNKRRAGAWLRWSWGAGWTGLVIWISYLLMSLYVMQINWGGFFFDEPRWKIPFTMGVVGLMLQAGLMIINWPELTAGFNALFAAALWCELGEVVNVLHPDSPVAQSGSVRIQIFFAILLILSLALAGQLAFWIIKKFPINKNE
jgi:hypothetical protein